MKIILGADHRGYELKNQIIGWLQQERLDYYDAGATTYDAEDDYNDYAKTVALSIQSTTPDFPRMGILVCGSAQGVAMQANRYCGVRAAICDAADQAAETRSHNDANILCLPADRVDLERAIPIIQSFLDTRPLEDEKYKRRNQKLDEE